MLAYARMSSPTGWPSPGPRAAPRNGRARPLHPPLTDHLTQLSSLRPCPGLPWNNSSHPHNRSSQQLPGLHPKSDGARGPGSQVQASSLASTGWGLNLSRLPQTNPLPPGSNPLSPCAPTVSPSPAPHSSRCAALSSATSLPPTFPRLFPTTSLPYQEVHRRHSSTLLLFLQTHPPHPQSGESSQSPPTTSVSETFSTMFPYLGPAPLFPEHYLYPH